MIRKEITGIHVHASESFVQDTHWPHERASNFVRPPAGKTAPSRRCPLAFALALTTAASLGVCLAPAQAQMITVPGFSFEDPALASYSQGDKGWIRYSEIPAVGWNVGGTASQVNVQGGGTDGTQCGTVNADSTRDVYFSSANSLVTIAARRRYALRVDMARSSWVDGTATAEISLFAGDPRSGGTILTTSGTLTPTADNIFRTQTLVWAVPEGSPRIGQGLYIKLANTGSGGQIAYDNVRLDIIPAGTLIMMR